MFFKNDDIGHPSVRILSGLILFKRFHHIPYAQQSGTDTDKGFHFHPGAIASADLDGTTKGISLPSPLNFATLDGNWVAVWDNGRGDFHRLDGSYCRGFLNITFGDFPGLNGTDTCLAQVQ